MQVSARVMHLSYATVPSYMWVITDDRGCDAIERPQSGIFVDGSRYKHYMEHEKASPADVAEVIEFVLPQGEPRMRFDLGDEFNVVSEPLAAREGRVVRHYDGGFALNFDGFMKADGDDA